MGFHLPARLRRAFHRPQEWYTAFCLALAAGLLWKDLSPLTVTAAALTLTSGVAMIASRFWGHISAVALLVLLALGSLVVCFQYDGGWLYLLVSLLAAGGAYLWWPTRWRPTAEEEFGSSADDNRGYSLVLLLGEPRTLDADELRDAAERAFHEEFGDDEDDNFECFVVGQPPMLLVKHHATILAVRSLDRVYVNDPEDVPPEFDPDLHRSAAGHKAWLRVDLVSPEHDELDDPYREIAQLLAALYDDDALVVFCPTTGQAALCDALTPTKLESDAPLSALFDEATARNRAIGADDPRMVSAMDEARRRWPEFVDAFGRREPGVENFVVKTLWTDGPRREDLWVSVTKIDGESIHGELDDEPLLVRNVRVGERVRVTLGDLKDWAIVGAEKRLKGGFTLRVAGKKRSS